MAGARGALRFCTGREVDSGFNNGRMVIDASGNVGIGTSTPSTKFEVRDSSATGISSRSTSTQATDGNKALKVRNNSDTDTFNVSYKGQGYFAGKLGIGTTSPVAKLNVDSGGTDLAAQLVSNDTNVFLAFKDGDASGNQQVQIGGEENDLVAYAGGSERMRIDSTGRVGIGTTSMSSSLNVYHATNNEMAKFESGDEYVHIVFKDSTTTNTPYIGAQGDNFRVITGGAEHMQIDENGNCKINSGNLVIGTAGKGIDFSQTSDSTGTNSSELFDDYEEGYWNPSLNKAGVTGNADSQVSIRAGYYVKSGSMLWISFYWYSGDLNFGTGSNAWYIGNVPFNLLTNQNSAYQFIPGGYLYQNSNTGVSHQASYRWQSNNTNGAATITMYGQGNTTNASGGAYEFSGCGVLRTS